MGVKHLSLVVELLSIITHNLHYEAHRADIILHEAACRYLKEHLNGMYRNTFEEMEN
jgi:hypothetical protein